MSIGAIVVQLLDHGAAIANPVNPMTATAAAATSRVSILMVGLVVGGGRLGRPHRWPRAARRPRSARDNLAATSRHRGTTYGVRGRCTPPHLRMSTWWTAAFIADRTVVGHRV